MKTLRISGCAVRGIVGESLTPDVALNFASAFAAYAEGGRVLVGRDTRDSSPMLDAAVKAGLLASGCEVVDFGICPTPLLQFLVRPYGAAGAVSISGGHNGMGWNAVTLIDGSGAWLDEGTGEMVLGIYHAGAFAQRDWQGQGRLETARGFLDAYLRALEGEVNVEAVRAARFRVVIDPIGGAGAPYLRPFAEWLNLDLVPIHAEPSGYLPREAEPRPRSARHIASVIRHVDGDAGFVHSSDMGRTSLVTETGEPASEEYTFAVAANHVLARRPGPIVTNGCTSRMVDRIAAERGVPLIKTRVGQAAVVAAMTDEQATLAGEGSGSVALAAFGPAFDGFLAMALVLEAMAERQTPLSGLLAVLPRLQIRKRRRPCGPQDAHRAIDRLRERLHRDCDGEVSAIDGLRIDWPDRWVHVRASRTEQMIRVISEAETAEAADQQADWMLRIVEQEL